MKHDDELRIAQATGAGCGKFLAAAMRDALQGGSDLAFLRPIADPTRHGIEFVLEGSLGLAQEVIRVELDSDGRVVRIETLRAHQSSKHRHYLLADALLQALVANKEILRMQWDTSDASVTGLVFTFENTTLRVALHDVPEPLAQ